MLASSSLCHRSVPPLAVRLQPLALRKLVAALSPTAGAEAGLLRNAAVLKPSRTFMHKADPPERDLHAVRRELARRENALAWQEQELARRLRELTVHEGDLRDREGLFSRADPGDTVDSYLTCEHADIAWSLTRGEILGANEAYPLESLWCTRGRLRCRLIVHSQGHFVKVSLTPAAVTGLDLKAFELQCTLSVYGGESHVIERLNLGVNEKDWHGNSLVIELDQCPEHTFVELKIHKFVGLLREGNDHFANQDVPYSATELVPSVVPVVSGEPPQADDASRLLISP